MSRSSPCCGARPCCSVKRWISSKPAMTRSSLAGRPFLFSGGANSASSAARSSRSELLIASLRPETHEGGRAFGKVLFPGVLRGNRWSPPTLAFELNRTLGDHFGILRRDRGALGRDGRRDLLQAVLAHGLGEDGVGFAKGVDAVDEVNVQLTHVHREAAHPVDQGGVGRSVALAFGDKPLGLLREVEGGDGVLAYSLLIFSVKLGIFVLDDLAHANLREFLGNQLFVEQA